jgi:hypothetical protein
MFHVCTNGVRQDDCFEIATPAAEFLHIVAV